MEIKSLSKLIVLKVSSTKMLLLYLAFTFYNLITPVLTFLLKPAQPDVTAIYADNLIVLRDVFFTNAYPFSIFAFALFVIYVIGEEIALKSTTRALAFGVSRQDLLIQYLLLVVYLGFVFTVLEALKMWLLGLWVGVNFLEMVSLLFQSIFLIYPLMILFGILGAAVIFYVQDRVIACVVFIVYRMGERILSLLNDKYFRWDAIEVLPYSLLSSFLDASLFGLQEMMIFFAWLLALMFVFSSLMLKREIQ